MAAYLVARIVLVLLSAASISIWEIPVPEDGSKENHYADRLSTGHITLDPKQGQTQHEATTVQFDSKVRRAQAALNGFDVQFMDGDHSLFRQVIDIQAITGGSPGTTQVQDPDIKDNTVRVRVSYLLRDNSGDIDDVYQGRVDVLVIADVE